MLLYCLKFRKKEQNVKLLKLQGQKMEEQCLYQNVQCTIVNNQNLLEGKNLDIKWFSNKDTFIIKFLFVLEVLTSSYKILNELNS